ncbi:hypothetical protein [Salinispira pacifica]
MADGKYQVLIVYSPESSSLASLASSMIPMFDQTRFVVTAVPAARVSVPQLLEADLLLFGSNDEANFSHGGYAAFREMLGDTRLSGRLAAFYSTISEISLKNLKLMLKGTGVTLADDGFIIRSAWDDPRTAGILRKWIGHIVKTHDEIARI